MMPDPGLTALDTFAAIARHGSFRRAAIERGVTASALSHAIRSLEAKLGARLFNRTSRSIRLTPAGENLLARITPALADIAEAIEHLRAQDGPFGRLRLNVPHVAAELVIAPMMAQFLAAHPKITLEIASRDGIVDLVAEGFDAGIRPGRTLSPDMVAVPVGEPRRFATVASPAYVARRGSPSTPTDLLGHSCLVRQYPSGRRFVWEFERDGEHVGLEIDGPLVLHDSTLMLRACRDGIGIAHVYEALAAPLVATGALVRVLEDWCPVLPPFFLTYPGRRQIRPPLRALIDTLRQNTIP